MNEVSQVSRRPDREVVESILQDTYVLMQAIKHDRDNEPDQSRSTFDMRTGKIRALSQLLDVFAEAGFEVRP